MLQQPRKETLKLAVVCASNQNRSMEAHDLLLQAGFLIKSFGTGSMVRLPGPSIDKPNNYKFGTLYKQMHQDLSLQNHQLYSTNGVLEMLERNIRIKPFPEKIQESALDFDVIFTCEERVFNACIDDLIDRQGTRLVHVINVDIVDNRQQAAVGAQIIFDLANLVYSYNQGSQLYRPGPGN